MNGKSIQCMCGFWSNPKPQNLWTEEDYQRAVAHQQAHLAMDKRLAEQNLTSPRKSV